MRTAMFTLPCVAVLNEHYSSQKSYLGQENIFRILVFKSLWNSKSSTSSRTSLASCFLSTLTMCYLSLVIYLLSLRVCAYPKNEAMMIGAICLIFLKKKKIGTTYFYQALPHFDCNYLTLAHCLRLFQLNLFQEAHLRPKRAYFQICHGSNQKSYHAYLLIRKQILVSISR